MARRCARRSNSSKNGKNGNGFHEGEMMGRLITLNEGIKAVNEKQLSAMEAMLERLASHDVYTRTQMANIKDDYSEKFRQLEWLFKWVIVPLIGAVVGIKVLELTKVLP